MFAPTHKATRKYLPDILGLLVLLLAILWFAREMVWDNKVPFFRDLGTYFYPLRFTMAQAFQAYELPLWDRHAAMGFPLLADFQSASFYPPHLVFFFLPFFTAIRFIFVFHYFVAATGAYLLCRRWNYRWELAVLGAILFTLGGTMVSLTNLLNHFQSAVWLPWSVFLWERFLGRRSWMNFVLLCLVLLTQLLAGSPEIYVLSMALLLVRGITLERLQGWRVYAKRFYLLILVNVGVALLGMAQLLPTAELLIESRRQEPIPYPEAVNWSLNPFSLVNLFFLDKEVNPQIGRGAQVFLGQGIPFLISYYMGAIALFGVCLWSVYSSWKEKLLLVSLVVLSLVLAFGHFTPVYPFLYSHVPPFGMLRYPEKFFFFTYALLLYMVLAGIAEFLRSEGRRFQWGLAILVSVFAFLFVFYVVLRFSPHSLVQFVARSTGLGLSPQLTVNSTASVLVNLERQLGLWCGLLLLMYAGIKGYLRQWLTNMLLVLTIFVDLSWAHQSYQYLLKPDFITKGLTILRAPQAELSRLFYYPPGVNLHPSYFAIRREPKASEIYSILFNNLLPNSGIFYGFDYMQDINALGSQSYINFLRFAHMVEPEKRFRLLGTLNVKYIVSFAPLDQSGITLVRHFPEYPSWLYEINQWVPRAYVVSNVVVEREPYKIMARLASADFDPHKVVMLDRQVSPLTPKKSPFVAQATIQSYTNNGVAISTTLSETGVLVLTDSFYPGWRVFVDGSEKEMLRANYFFRGVALSAGAHRVEFRYQPRAFTVGCIISLLSLAGLIFTSVLRYFLQRKKLTLIPASQS